MCGICGVWYFDSSRPVHPEFIKCMTDQIVHRGPDDEGCYVNGSVGLGFRRLSIIDVAGSPQPMPNEDEHIWIVFNGEIYNYQTLRAQLQHKHTLRTKGDTETILHAYEEYGPDCVDYLRGMFAFAIYDGHQDRMTLAVDRFGKKPLYYLLDEEKLLFGSELKVILQHPNVSRELDMEALDEYLAFGHITAPRTIFRSIRKLPPGHFMIVDRNRQSSQHMYWHPNFLPPAEQTKKPLDESAAVLRELLFEAVRLRMISDVPLGAFLSGGVDSSAIVAIMSQISTQPVKTFSIGFEERDYDETHYAQLVADQCHTDHVREVVRPDVMSILPKLIHQFDEPFADSSMVPTYWVSQVARKHVTVALSGDGGDEVFGGYPWYTYGYRHNFLQSLIPVSIRPTAERIGKVIPRFTKLRPYLSVVNQPVEYWGTRFTSFFSASSRAQLYTHDAVSTLGGYEGEKVKIDAFRHVENKLDWLSQMQYCDLTVYMPADILVKVDRASMLASLEVRAPLLDHIVFEYVATLPKEYKRTYNNSKVILKRALGDLLPPAIHTRSKQGFGMPQSEWLAGPLNELMRETLTSKQAQARGLFDPAFVNDLIEAQQAHHQSDYRLWALLCFELWANEYLT